MKKLKKLIAAALLVVGCVGLGHAATTRYAEIRTSGTLQPDTTNYGCFLGSGTINNFRVTQATVTTNLLVQNKLTIARSLSGSNVSSRLQNLSNTANSGAFWEIFSAGSSAGDAWVQFSGDGGSADFWSIGEDQSDNKSLLFTHASTLGAAGSGGSYNVMRFDGTTGAMTVTTGTVTSFTATSSTINVANVTRFEGTTTDNSTTTFTGTLSTLNAASTANHIPKYTQVKMIGFQSNSVSIASTTTSATFGKSTLTVNITPTSTNSQIKITANFTGTTSNLAFTCEFRITRAGSAVTNGAELDWGGGGVATGSLVQPLTVMGIDSPLAATLQTYEVSFRNLSGGITCGIGSGALKSMIIAEEINGN